MTASDEHSVQPIVVRLVLFTALIFVAGSLNQLANAGPADSAGSIWDGAMGMVGVNGELASKIVGPVVFLAFASALVPRFYRGLVVGALALFIVHSAAEFAPAGYSSPTLQELVTGGLGLKVELKEPGQAHSNRQRQEPGSTSLSGSGDREGPDTLDRIVAL